MKKKLSRKGIFYPFVKKQTRRIMRLTFLFLLLGLVHVSASSYSQNTKLSLDFQGVKVREVMQAIENQSRFRFAYSSEFIDLDRKVNISMHDQDIHKILETLFSGTTIRYEVDDRLIMLYATQGKTAFQQQNRTVTGTVKDASGSPLPGVTVVIKSTMQGTNTDINGNFSFTKVSDNSVLVFSFVGYVTQEIQVGTQTEIDVLLKENMKEIDEVVVVGFGTQKKVNLTGSVGVATAEAFKERPVMTAAQALQGMVPGLQVSQRNGTLSDRPEINIRGMGTIGEGSSGSPLILVDGMASDINAINPQDIESISVLKDAASSSIYGSRAPFGVILVTTKKGKAGKAKVNYNNNIRWSTPINLPKWMDSYTFALFWNDAKANSGAAPYFDEEHLQRIIAYQKGELKESVPANPATGRWYDGYLEGNDNVDYYDALYREWVPSYEHNLSLNGGNERTTYYTSLQYVNQNGLMEFNQDKYKRFTGTLKVNVSANDWLQLNVSTRFIRENYGRATFQRYDLWDRIGRQSWPTLPLYDPNGYLYNTPSPPLNLRDGGRGEWETDNIYNQIQIVLEPIKNWKTFGEFNYWIKNANQHWNMLYTYNHDINGNPYLSNTASRVHEDQAKDNYLNANIYSEYSRQFGQHVFKVMGGFQTEASKDFQFSAQRDGIIVPGLNEIDLTSGMDYQGKTVAPTIGGSRKEWATVGFFGRLNYDYRQKYLFEVDLRYDGSSRFRSENRWAFFPSVSAGWNIAYEGFWASLQKHVNLLKIRASYGELGNQNTSSWYPTYQIMTVGSADGSWLLNSAKPNTATVPGLVSSSLTWETVKTWNLGLDVGAFNNRFNASFDYFMRYTYDMVGPAPELPLTLGTSVPKTNNTDLKTYGFELSLGWTDRLRCGLSYSVNLSLSDTQTEITRYPNETGTLYSYRKGMKLGEIWGYTTKGIAKTQEEMDNHLSTLSNGGQNALGSLWRAGDIMYEDTNNDGKISSGAKTIDDHGDLRIIGNKSPRYHFGLDLGVKYKGFDLRAFFQGVLKRDFFNNGYFFFGAINSEWWSVGFEPHKDYFRDDPNHPLGENLDAYFARPYFNTVKNQSIQTRYLLDASYVRLKNLQLGYTLPNSLTNKIAMSDLRIFVSGENLFTITKMFEVFDPETIDGGLDTETVVTETRRDTGSGYPLVRVISVGLSVNF